MAKKKTRGQGGQGDFAPQDDAIADGEHIPHEALEESAAWAAEHGAPFPSPVLPQPSALGNPYLSEEDQGMEMSPVVVGPPAYGSPDPTTSAGKLLPLNQHPLNPAALPKDHPAAIDGDYGEGYGGNLVAGRRDRTDLERHLVGDRTQENNAEIDATDSARELADYESVDLSEVDGTGADGRITKTDVEEFVRARGETNQDNE